MVLPTGLCSSIENKKVRVFSWATGMPPESENKESQHTPGNISREALGPSPALSWAPVAEGDRVGALRGRPEQALSPRSPRPGLRLIL